MNRDRRYGRTEAAIRGTGAPFSTNQAQDPLMTRGPGPHGHLWRPYVSSWGTAERFEFVRNLGLESGPAELGCNGLVRLCA